jgi:hypothetical protein
MNPFKRIPLIPILIALALIFLGAITAVLAITDATYDLSWWTVNGGGNTTSGGNFSLSGTAGQYDAGDLSGGEYDLGGGYWATDGDKFIFIPVALNNYCGGFSRPREKEPNNDPSSANGPLCLFKTYKGSPDNDYPELESDWFYFTSNGGAFTVSVTKFLKSKAQVLLYYQNSGNFKTFQANQASGNYILSHNGPAGKYLVRVVAEANHLEGNGDYNLKVTKP